jgi:hypothetical protein
MASPQRESPATPRAGLGLFVPSPEVPEADPTFMINGFPALVLVWTPRQWKRLRAWERPLDAQPCPNGCWAALRMV